MTFYLKGKAGQKEVMKKISIKNQKAALSTQPAARLHQNLQMKCKTSDLVILLPRNCLPHDDQYYNTHRDMYFYLNLYLIQWELQTLSHTNSYSSRRVKMAQKKLEGFQVLYPFSPFPWNGTKTILKETVQNRFVLLEHLVSKATYFRIEARGFIHSVSQTLAVLLVLSIHCPSFIASKAKHLLKTPLKGLNKCLNFQDLSSIALSKSDRK